MVKFFINFKLIFNFQIKNKTIIIENIDRNGWDVIIYLFKKTFESKNEFIFTYSLENLLERYKEKYHMEINLQKLLDKFITKHIDLQKYKNSDGLNIKKMIIQDLDDEITIDKSNNQMKTFIESIDLLFFNNFRMLKRTVYKIKKNWFLLQALGIEEKLAFYIEYLSISDRVAYNWIYENKLEIMNKRDDFYKWFDEDDFNYYKIIEKTVRDEVNKNNENNEMKIEQIPNEVKNSLGLSKQICKMAYSLKSHYDFINAFLDENAVHDYNFAVKINNEISFDKKYSLIKKQSFKNLDFENKLISENFENFNDHIKLENLNIVIKDKESLEEKIAIIKKIDIRKLHLLECMHFLIYIFDNIVSQFYLKKIYKFRYKSYLRVSYILENLEKFYKEKDGNSEYNNDLLLSGLKEFIKKIEVKIKKDASELKLNHLLNFDILNKKLNYKIYVYFIPEALIMSNEKLTYKEHFNLLIKNEYFFKDETMHLKEFLMLFSDSLNNFYDAKDKEFLIGDKLSNSNNNKIILRKWLKENDEEWKKIVKKNKKFYDYYRSYWSNDY